MSPCSDLPAKCKKDVTTTGAWGTILNAGKSNDTSRDCQGGKKKPVGLGLAPEDDYDSITTALQEVIAHEVILDQIWAALVRDMIIKRFD